MNSAIFWHFVFMAATAYIVVRDIRNGIEKFAKYIMPLLFGILILLALFGVFLKGAGDGLAFITVPSVFKSFPGGSVVHYILTLLFFSLLPVAALTSSVATLELVVAYFTEELGWKRIKASIVAAAVMFLMGIPFALSVGAVPALNIGEMVLCTLLHSDKIHHTGCCSGDTRLYG